MTQIARVLQVSVKLLAVALTCRVTLRPKKLKREILMAIATPEYMTVGVLIIWYHPRPRSKNGEAAATEGIARIGNSIRIEMVPNNPSKPTATKGDTAYRPVE